MAGLAGSGTSLFVRTSFHACNGDPLQQSQGRVGMNTANGRNQINTTVTFSVGGALVRCGRNNLLVPGFTSSGASFCLQSKAWACETKSAPPATPSGAIVFVRIARQFRPYFVELVNSLITSLHFPWADRTMLFAVQGAMKAAYHWFIKALLPSGRFDCP